MDIKEKIASLPSTSGVYLMKNAGGSVLYIGKAVSLKKRVQSYFRKSPHHSKTDFLVSEIRDIDHIETASEAEALILEASLIKEHQPKYNVDLRDDKSYPFIEISDEEFPLVSVVRLYKRKFLERESSTGKTKAKYFGPYVEPRLIREALSIIRRIFHFRTCHPFPKKACLDYHMGLCDAPCEGRMDKKQYAKIIRNVCLILEGKKDDLYKNLRKDMEAFSQERNFEEALKVREQIRAIGALYSGTKDINFYKEAEQLERALALPKSLERVEAFDISNTMGEQAVGSMVSFLNGKPDKNNYRRFRIRDINGSDDFKMIAQVVRRRYTRLKNEKLPFPDLIIIDGGKGQLSSACAELKKLDVSIPIISIAKKQEEIFLPNRRYSIRLAKNSLGLRLIQRVRDEAHRFAITYHRKLRGRDALNEKR